MEFQDNLQQIFLQDDSFFHQTDLSNLSLQCTMFHIFWGGGESLALILCSQDIIKKSSNVNFLCCSKRDFFELKMSSFKYKHYHFLLKWWRFHWHHLPFKFPFWTQNIAICWLFYENLCETMKKKPRENLGLYQQYHFQMIAVSITCPFLIDEFQCRIF